MGQLGLRPALAGGLCLAAIGWGQVCVAQDSGEVASAEPGTIPVESHGEQAPARHPGSTLLDEITVTARKKEESLQEVPVSVTAFNSGEMERRGFAGLEDLARATPGFTFEPYISGGAHAAPVMRGLAQTFTTARIQNVSFFLDGVYLQRQSMVDLGMVDLERIEIMKGPQNALYGRNAFAGAVNYITLAPSKDPEGYLVAGTGDNDRQLFRVGVTGPITDDGSLYGKLTLGSGKYEGHTPNNHPMANANPPGFNQRGNLGGYDDETYSFSLAYEPFHGLKVRGNYYYSDLVHESAPGYTITGVHTARFDLRFDYQNDLNCLVGTVPDIGNPSVSHTGFSAYCGELPKYASDIPDYDNNGTPEPSRRVAGIVQDPRAKGSLSKTGLTTLLADYDFSDDIRFHYAFGLATHESFTDGGVADEDAVAGRGIYVDATKDTQDRTAYVFANTASSRPNSVLDEYSHELRMDWAVNDRLGVSIGGYHSRVQDEEWTELIIADLCNADTPENMANCSRPFSYPNTISERTVLTVGVAYDQYHRQHGKGRGEWSQFDDTISALFTSVNYDVTDDVAVALEGRYAVDKKVIDRLTDPFQLKPGESVTYTNPPDPIIPGLADTLESLIQVPHDEATFREFTPRGIVTWDWADTNMVYGSVAKGVKAGGFNNSGVVSEQEYDPETNWTWELGSKNRIFGFITLNAAVYYIKWEALQGQSPPANPGISSSDVVANIGGATSKGVELEGMAFLTDGVSVDVAASFSNPTYDDGVIFRAAGPDPDGVAQKIFCDDVVCPADGSVGGNQLARTSRRQWSAGLNYIQDLAGYTLHGRLDTNYQSRQFVEPVNLAWVPARQITNASLTVQFPGYHWEVNSWVKNLTDEDYAANSFYIGAFDHYMVGKGAPRTFGMSLKYKF